VTPQAESALTSFRDTGAYLTGDFQYPAYAERLGAALAATLRSAADVNLIDIVVSLAMGGHTTGKMTLRRGFTIQPNQVAVVVEDVITTGGPLCRQGLPVAKPGSRT
jgi:orotate phosphoribosyltransferase